MSSRESQHSHGGASHAEAHAALSDAPFRIAAISLVVTASLLVLKLVLGLISDSIAVLSDAVDSGTDLAAGFAALISVRIARQPADDQHPFGHGKAEALSAAVAATIIAVGGFVITYQAIQRLIEGSPEIHVEVGLVAMGIAAAANVIVGGLMAREARRSDSMALKAESTHLRTNVVQAGTIIAGLLLVWATDEEVFDPITALLLAAYMAFTAIGLVRTAMSEILDTALPEDELQAIRDVLTDHGREVRGYHNVRTRRSGATRHVDMHVLFDPQRTVTEVHDTADAIADDIARALPGCVVVIHPEPDADGEEPGGHLAVGSDD
jgi:cation diffusion facilitator family transporter